VLFVIALLGFGAAAVLALLVAHPRHLQEVDRAALRAALEPEQWNEPDHKLLQATLDREAVMELLRDANRTKARLLSAALIATAAGILFLLAGVVSIVVA
jgi:hypothetical protein